MKELKFQDFPKTIYARIEDAAVRSGRSVNDEIRYALGQYYNAVPHPSDNLLTARLRWRQEVGSRLDWICERLADDGLLPPEAGLPHLARAAGESSAGHLIDCREGRCDLDFGLADRLSAALDFRVDWLLCGTGDLFHVTDLDQRNNWEEFFPKGPDIGRFRYEFMRVNGLHNEGILLCFCHDAEGHMTAGLLRDLFRVTAGPAFGKWAFWQFFAHVKSQCLTQQLYSTEYIINADSPDFITDAVGQHHPKWFTLLSRRCPSLWLTTLLAGENPWPGPTGYDDKLRFIAALQSPHETALISHASTEE